MTAHNGRTGSICTTQPSRRSAKKNSSISTGGSAKNCPRRSWSVPRLVSIMTSCKVSLAWKMHRGSWRERNRQLIAAIPPEKVEEVSREAFAAIPDPRKPVAILSTLPGVGPATASAALAAYAPHIYPFFDELVAAFIPGLGPVAFTMPYYLKYASALRERADLLNATCPDTDLNNGNAPQMDRT